MLKIDFWKGNKMKEITEIDCCFYPDPGIYRGNLYINKWPVADFSGNNSVEIEKYFKKYGFELFRD